LGVHAALAGEHVVGGGRLLVEAYRTHHQFDARHKNGGRAGQEGRAEPSAGPGSRQIPNADAGRCFDDLGPVGEGTIEQGDVVGSGALLGAEYCAGSGLAEQRVGYVAGDLYPAVT